MRTDSPSTANAGGRSSSSRPRHHIIITGTGRAGTTFLVRLLTALHLPTGYTEKSWKRAYCDHGAAGLETDLADPAAPYIVKNPHLCVTLGPLLERGDVIVDHAIVPVRELDAAVSSRVRIGGTDGEVPGGLVGTDDPTRQRLVLAERFHQLVHTLVAHEVPHTLLLFPRLALDSDYAFAKLSPLFPEVSRAEFAAAFAATADPQLVHTFSRDTRVEPNIAENFRRQARTDDRRRRIRHSVRWALAIITVAALLLLYWRHGFTSPANAPGARPVEAASGSAPPSPE